MFLFNLFPFFASLASSTSFNPCFNGCSSSTVPILGTTALRPSVSILVLMDVPLQPKFKCHRKYDHSSVSILVLMDVPLQQGRKGKQC